MNAFEVRNEILSWLSCVPSPLIPPSAGERGVVTGLMNTALRLNKDMGIANDRRRQVLAWIFRDSLGKPNASWISAKDLSDEMWWALYKYTDPHKDQDSRMWVAQNGFSDAMYVCWDAMEKWQREMDGQLGFVL